MAKALKVEIIKKETIKPTSPTPDNLKHLKLSLLDQIAAASYTPLLLFYPVNYDHGDQTTERSISLHSRLKSSLSDTLSLFYPLAGKTINNSSIDCNDDGVDYIEAHASYFLSDILKQPNVDLLKKFLPIEIESTANDRRMLLVQSTFFECGGMVLGVSISHKIADASSMTSFIKTWSNYTALGSSNVQPKFIGESLFAPPLDFAITMPAAELVQDAKCVTTRLVFDGSKIVELKAKAASEKVMQPTRVEAVTGLIWKCAMATSAKSSFVLSQTVNLRKRLTPPLDENSIGNLLGHFITQTASTSEEKPNLKDLVCQLREGIKEFTQHGVKKYEGIDAFSKICESMKESFELYKIADRDFYICSSWSKFSLYEANFGWGNPAGLALLV